MKPDLETESQVDDPSPECIVFVDKDDKHEGPKEWVVAAIVMCIVFTFAAWAFMVVRWLLG